MNKKKLIIVLALIVVLIVLIFFGTHILSDRKGPEISIPDNISYTEGDDKSVLLQGVKAVDNSGDDASSTLIVAKLIILNDGEHAKVTYAARDKKNNLTEKSVTIDYTRISKPSENESESSTEEETTTTEPETTTPVAETPASSSEAPVMKLTTNEITVAKGTEVKWLKYVESIIDDKDKKNDLYKYIMINDYADTNKVGDYTVKYSCKDSDGHVSPVVSLKVHVNE